MPKIRLSTLIPATPWTKMPNTLLDRWLPKLKDTELRVLLILVRQTTGWRQDGAEVRLSYKALMARTGRGSEAVANALRSLAFRGLIHIPRTSLLRPSKPVVPETEHNKKQKD